VNAILKAVLCRRLGIASTFYLPVPIPLLCHPEQPFVTPSLSRDLGL